MPQSVPNTRVVALAGNPNVGKSTVFNALTASHQHTGNWPGKTVANAEGHFATAQNPYRLVDVPGCYSLMAHSPEEEVARNFICFGESDAVAVVCDATCLERNLNLALQCMELAKPTVLCINLMDEAKRKGITVRTDLLSARLGIPVVAMAARKKRGLCELCDALDRITDPAYSAHPYRVRYCDEIEHAVSMLIPAIPSTVGQDKVRWLALRLLDSDPALQAEIERTYGKDFFASEALRGALSAAKSYLGENGFDANTLHDRTVSALLECAASLCDGILHYDDPAYNRTDRRIDRLLTGRLLGYPVMLLLLAFIFYLTLSGANVPSQLLADGLFWVQNRLLDLFTWCNAPAWLRGVLIDGAFRVTAWVTAVMLPPMAIFFPLFTLLEDVGYLPRIAYNLDRPFRACHACGKQALTMCMGFGCNAAGVVGCRIIDSPRERLLAMLTNAFVPCNGRFPILITMICIFFVPSVTSFSASIGATLFLCAVVLLGIVLTFCATKLLSHTVLRGQPSAFTLELPPYRPPQVGRIIVRSVADRTLFVLGRSIAVSAPAGALLWILANLQIDGVSILRFVSEFLDPFAVLLGLDGVILLAFILGLPANEIVLPIAMMIYLGESSLNGAGDYAQIGTILRQNGWTWTTAVSVMLFSLCHWPCSTTLLTVKKESGSWAWTALAAALPTAFGIFLCFGFHLLF